MRYWRPSWPLIFVVSLCAAHAAFARRVDNRRPPRPSNPTQQNALPHLHWNNGKQGKFITALCRDHQGHLWVGTEDHGIWEYVGATGKTDNSGAKDWRHFTVKSTGGTLSKLGPVLTAGTSNEHALGDNHIYALACDRLGRIWVGTLNHGVSVYNGKSSGGWENYGVLNGPLGGRVFDIATCPVDGDVWIATNAGLTRYSLTNDSWTYYTRQPGKHGSGGGGGGLPSNQIQAIAFAPDGTIYAATQCHGLATCKPKKNHHTGQLVYQHWHTVTSRFTHHPPGLPMGRGLPSNLLNDVMVARDGTIWVATDEGLAWSRDHGASWRFVRGRDWEAKDKELYHGPPKKRIEAVARRFHRGNLLLSEDYCTCLAEGAAGYIWVGHWQKGIDVFDPRTGKAYRSNGKPIRPQPPTSPTAKGKKPSKKLGPRDDVYTILAPPPTAGQPPIVGFYGGGAIRMPARFNVGRKHSGRAGVPPATAHTNRPTTTYPKLPSPAASPTVNQLRTMLLAVDRAPSAASRSRHSHHLPLVVPLDGDWRTEGDWLGRYGKYWACLCAICSPNNYIWGAGSEHIDYYAQIGPHHRKDDTLRYWVQWLYTTNPNVLELPPTYLDSRIIKGYTTRQRDRRGASCDDHGEHYPMTFAGPNVYWTLTIPKGLFCLSLYFFNKDGHSGRARLRDYRILIHPHPARWPLKELGPVKRLPTLAMERVHNFWGAVYKQFLVRGPTALTIEIERNYSEDTIISGVFLDSFNPTPPPFFHDNGQTFSGRLAAAPAAGRPSRPSSETAHTESPHRRTVATRLFLALEAARRRNPRWWAIHADPIYTALLRYDLSLNPKQRQTHLRQIGVCYYRLNLLPRWEATQKRRGLRTIRSVEKAVRWNPKTKDCSGHGREIAMRYLRSHPSNHDTVGG